MDLKFLARTYLILAVSFLLLALVFAWWSRFSVTLAMLPLSALLGWVFGALWIVPAQRRIVASRGRGRVDSSQLGWITGAVVVVGMYLIPSILRPLGWETETGVVANICFFGAAALLPVLLDLRRQGFPWPESHERSRQRPDGRFGLRRKGKPPRGREG